MEGDVAIPSKTEDKERMAHSSRQTSRGKSPKQSKHVSYKKQVFSLDPTLKRLDFSEYEELIMQAKSRKDINFKEIVSTFLAKDKPEIIPNKEKFPETKSSVKVLKAAPEMDENDNLVQSVQNIFIDCNCPRTESNDTMSNWKALESESNTILVHTQPREKEVFDYEEENNNEEVEDSSKSKLVGSNSRESSCNLSVTAHVEIRQWINKFTQAYENELRTIEDSIYLDPIKKVQEQNTIYKWWITDIYEQNGILIDSLDEIESSAAKDILESDGKIQELKELKEMLRKVQNDKLQLKKSITRIKKQATNVDLIERLNDGIDTLREEHVQKDLMLERSQKDLDALVRLVIRLRDGGVWDLDGLGYKMSEALYDKLFGDHKNILGTRVEIYDEMEKERLKLKEEIRKMKAEREYVRAKIFTKTGDLQKLNNKVEESKAFLRAAKEEETDLMARIEELREEKRGLEMEEGRNDTYNDFVKM